MSRRRPRSNTMRVVRCGSAAEADWCWTRKEREGTLLFASLSAGVMKKRSGRVRLPALRAWTEAVAIVREMNCWRRVGTACNQPPAEPSRVKAMLLSEASLSHAVSQHWLFPAHVCVDRWSPHVA